MGALPTIDEVLTERGDLAQFLRNGKTVEVDFMPNALKRLKLDLFNKRATTWDKVFIGDDATGNYITVNNATQLKLAISLLTAEMVFEDAALGTQMDTWDLMKLYQKKYDDLVGACRLDIDLNGNGEIAEDEKTQQGGFFKL